jgi:RNA polymerase sigma factor (sigma-70 family)
MQPSREPRTDADLLRECARDPDAFGELYARHVDAVHRWFAARLEWAASDLTAETFARAWLSRRRFRDQRDGTALPWLLGIARNVLAATLRHERVESAARRRLGLPCELAEDDGYAAVDDRLSPRRSVTEAIARLSHAEREALELRVIGELPYDEVSARLGIRPAAVRLRVFRALRRVSAELQEDR